MKAVKFACPVCGQHINADADSAGSQIDCPTCFQKLVIPSAPTSQEGKLVLSTTQVRKPRPVTSSGSIHESTPIRSKRFSWKLTVAAGFLLCMVASAFVFRSVLFDSNQSNKTASADGEISRKGTAHPVADASMTYPLETPDERWKLDLTSAAFTDNPAEGRIHGAVFTCGRAYLQNGTLTLLQGESGPSDLSVSIALRQPGLKWNGNRLLIDSTTSPAPHMTLRWRTPDQQTESQTFLSGYAMKLEVGQPTNGKAPGKIYLCAPDDAKSLVVGTFTLEARRPRVPQP